MQGRGWYGNFGGAYLPEILVKTFEDLEKTYLSAKQDSSFWQDYESIMASYAGRPTPITFAANLTDHFGGARVYIKREE